MSDQTAGLTYKGRPLMRKDNMIYYGSMADSHIVMLQVLDSKPVNGLNVAPGCPFNSCPMTRI